METSSGELQVLQNQILDLKEENKDLAKRISKVEMSREKTEFQYDEIMKALDKLNDKTIPGLMQEIEALKDKPIKRYDTVITSIITGVVSAIIAYIVAIFKSKGEI